VETDDAVRIPRNIEKLQLSKPTNDVNSFPDRPAENRSIVRIISLSLVEDIFLRFQGASR
jgi:hypothetical protein